MSGADAIFATYLAFVYVNGRLQLAVELLRPSSYLVPTLT
jgi:hypothetical protein